MFLQTVQKNNHKIITTFRLMIKRIFIRNCCGSNDFVDDFKSVSFVILDHCVLSKNTVTERDLIKLSKSIDKKGSNLLTDNFHCFSGNRHMKNI